MTKTAPAVTAGADFNCFARSHPYSVVSSPVTARTGRVLSAERAAPTRILQSAVFGRLSFRL